MAQLGGSLLPGPSLRTGNDLLDFWQLRAHFVGPFVEHRRYISDASRGIRKQLEFKQWRRGRELGRGAFGTVFLEKEREGELRAVKELQKSTYKEKAIDYLREILAMANMSKDNGCFIQLYGWYSDAQAIYIAMEYAPHGDLQDCVKQPLPEAEARTIIQQIVEALEILHSKNWAHRDLKPSNVFVIQKGPSWWVKLGDLGVSKRVADEMTRYRTTIETDFTAPEVLGFVGAGPEEASSYTNTVDIWSLGCLMHWLLTLKLPLTRRQMNAFCIDALDLPLQHLMERHVTDDGIDFVLSLLQPHPEQRPTANRIIGHKWLCAIADFSSFTKSGLGVRLDTQPNCIPGQRGTVGGLAAGLPNIKALQIQLMPQDHREDNTTIKTPSASARGYYDITRYEKKIYNEIVRAWDEFGKGYIPENIAFTIMRQSNLKQRDLEAIWKLADGNKRGRLDIDEFAVAMDLVYKRLNGYPVPAHLPSELMWTSKMGFNSFNGTVQDPHQKPLAQHSPHEVRSLQGSPSYDPRYIQSEFPGHYEPQNSGQSDGSRLDVLRDVPVYRYWRSTGHKMADADTPAAQASYNRLSEDRAPNGHNLQQPRYPVNEKMSSTPPPIAAGKGQQGHHRRSSTLRGLGERVFGRSLSARREGKDEPFSQQNYEVLPGGRVARREGKDEPSSQQNYEVLPGGRVARFSALQGEPGTDAPQMSGLAGIATEGHYHSDSDPYGDSPDSKEIMKAPRAGKRDGW